MKACKGTSSMRQKGNFSFEVGSMAEGIESANNAIIPTADIATAIGGIPQIIAAICFVCNVLYIHM